MSLVLGFSRRAVTMAARLLGGTARFLRAASRILRLAEELRRDAERARGSAEQVRAATAKQFDITTRRAIREELEVAAEMQRTTNELVDARRRSTGARPMKKRR